MNASMIKRLVASAAVVLAVTGALWIAAPRAGTAAAAPAAASHLRCGAPRHASGHVSLDQISRRTKVPVAIILDFAFRCSHYQGGGWTPRMATYLNRGSLRVPLPKGTWYWLLPLP